MNVVVLYNDQHAHDFLGCAGYPGLKTPAADRLAKDGLRFTQATCAVTPCLPSRHSFINGQYAFQTGVYSNNCFLPPSEVPAWTMGKSFQAAGFTTGALGKMHMFPYWAPVERGDHLGFDRRDALINEAGENIRSSFVDEHRDWMEFAYEERKAAGIGMGGDNCAAAFKGFLSKEPLSHSRDYWAAQKTVSFIDENQGRPFFAFSGGAWPHAPHLVPFDAEHQYDPKSVELPPEPPDDLPDRNTYKHFEGLKREELKTAIANYMGVVSAADSCHGMILEALDQNGLYDEALIVLTSDHGELLGSRGVTSFSKYNLFEQSIRVPLIIKPPKSWNSPFTGKTSDFLASSVDMLPTLLDMAGVDVPGHLPGISLKPLFSGESTARKRPAALVEFKRGKTVHYAVRSQEWKYTHGQFGDELYHLKKDPLEFNNLAGTPEGKERIHQMKDFAIEEMRIAAEHTSGRRNDYETVPWSVFND